MSQPTEMIPPEYKLVFSKIPENERDSFYYTYNNLDEDDHEYLMLLDAIIETIRVFRNPSPYWMYMVGKLCFTTSRYQRLHELRSEDKYTSNSALKIFESRLLTYKNEFEDAEKIVKEVLDEILIEADLELIDVLLWFEGLFSLGMVYIFGRQFDKLQETINLLEENSSKYKLKKPLDTHYIDMIYYEHILKVSIAFHTGKVNLMSEELQVMFSWIDNIQCPWRKGYYYNLLGISYFIKKEMKTGEDSLKLAYNYFKQAHDLRGFTAVGANLGVSYISQGLHKEGREYIENVLKPMVQLENYSFAITFMLTCSKSYVNDKDSDNALRMLSWAEEVSQKARLREPATFSLFSYFYARIGDVEKSDNFLAQLRILTNLDNEEIESDTHALLWFYSAAAVNALVKGELASANEYIEEGIKLATKQKNYDIILESTLIQIEILLKRYMIEDINDIKYIEQTLDVLDDLLPLLFSMDNAYYESIFNLVSAYLHLAIGNDVNAKTAYDQAVDKAKSNEEATQNHEIQLYNNRKSFITRAAPGGKVENPLYADFMDNWLSDEFIEMIYVMEALRLSASLQFHKASIGGGARDEDVVPSLLLIVNTSGITIFSHKFDDAGTNVDEVLIGGFLSAITSFSKELFGGGQLSRIDQDNFILLIEKTTGDNFVVLIVEKETFGVRKAFKKFLNELAMTRILDYISADVFLAEHDYQYAALKDLIISIFSKK